MKAEYLRLEQGLEGATALCQINILYDLGHVASKFQVVEEDAVYMCTRALIAVV